MSILQMRSLRAQVALNVHKARKEQDDRDATHRSQINTLSSLTDQLRGPHSQRPSEAEVDRQLLLVGLKPRSAGAESQTTPDPAQHLSWKDAWKARPAPPVEPSSSGTSFEGASSAVPAPLQATSQQPEKHCKSLHCWCERELEAQAISQGRLLQ